MSWIDAIAGITGVLSGSGSPQTTRRLLKVVGQPVADDGAETVIGGGIQAIAGSGTWDGHSGTVLVQGSGARAVSLPEPTDPHAGLKIVIAEIGGSAGVIAITPTGGGHIGLSTGQQLTLSLPAQPYASCRLMWLQAGLWSQV